jgi:uncharacterized protein YbjT (DUF2867 family)
MMTTFHKTALVLGATGQQGGVVARQLRANKWRVRALVRDPRKPEAQALQRLGIELVQGDLDTPASVTSAMQDMHGVFSVQAVLSDPEQEVRQGKTVADSAKTTGISHLVYSSAGGADRNIGIAAFKAKGEIEQYIRSLDVPATILRPVMFMENFRFFAQVVNEFIHLPSLGPSETKNQMIAVRDIGTFATFALNDPDTYIGKVLEIAGDELTFSQIAEVLQKVFGRPVSYQTRSPEQDQNLEGARKATAFFEREGYKADIASLRQIHPQLIPFEAWLRQAGLPL